MNSTTTFTTESWLLTSIRPYERNARQIPEKAVEKVALSLTEFGWRQPIVVDKDGVIVAGHTRYLAAVKLGWTSAPVHVAANLTPEQVKTYRIMDNRSHEETTWDYDLLPVELHELEELGANLELTGFDTAQVNELMAQLDGVPVPDRPGPRPPGAPASSDNGNGMGEVAVTSYIRMLQVFVPVDRWDVLLKQIEVLKSTFGLHNASDVVMAAVDALCQYPPQTKP